MKTCKTCRFWAEVSSDGSRIGDMLKEEFNGKGTCSSPKMVMCRSFELMGGMPDDQDILCHWGDHDYDSNINTGPDFGCIHHEDKE